MNVVRNKWIASGAKMYLRRYLLFSEMEQRDSFVTHCRVTNSSLTVIEDNMTFITHFPGGSGIWVEQSRALLCVTGHS